MLGATWTLDVHNITKGWTLSTYQGKAGQALDAVTPLLLQAPFKGSWGWSDYPSGWLPRQASFEVRALTAAALEDGASVDPGDLVDVHLYLTIDTPPFGVIDWTWHRVVGYLDEPEASQDDRGLVVKLTAVDPLAQLAEVPVDDPTPWPSESLGARLSRIAQAANINILSTSAWSAVATMGPVTVNNQGALPLIQACLSGAQASGSQLVLRATVGDHEWEDIFDGVTYDVQYLGDAPLYDVDGGGAIVARDKPVYVIDVVGRTSQMRSPYVLTSVTSGAIRTAQRAPIADLSTVTGGAALDAGDVLRESTSWIKSRATAVNQVKLVGLDAAGEEKSVLAQYADLVKRDGPSTRVVQTHRLIDGGALAVATALLPDRVTATPGWTADAFTLTTKALSDDELRAAARGLHPGAPEGVVSGMQMPLAIVGVDDTAALTGRDLSGVLQGATLQIDKSGVLTLTGDLRMEQLRASGLGTNMVTWDQLKVQDVANEPAIDWDTFTWRDTLRVFDADESGDPALEQLSWLDLRLTKVES